MAKHRKPAKRGGASPSLPAAKGKRSLWIPGGILMGILIVGAAATALRRGRDTSPAAAPSSTSVAIPTGSVLRSAPPAQTVGTPPAAPGTETNATTLEVNKSVMVTVELDFGNNVPTIAGALREIERRYQPDDGVGRTFAILDAYGDATAEGKLHMSMHISSEKPGLASLIFKRTGAVLWQNRVVPSTNDTRTFSGKDLLVLVDSGDGKLWTIDGSSNPLSVLDADLKELGKPLRDVWVDGTAREMVFIYSACGCPVKVMTQRVGDRTVRTTEMPVMFPDDPAVVEVISRLMRWNG